MSNPTLLEYAQIAYQIYDDESAFALHGWVCQHFKADKPVFSGGDLTSDGF